MHPRGIICGVPSRMQILIEKIVDHYGLDSIHQIWPNLNIYVHGGVNFDPYMSKFNSLFNSKVIYLDIYLCSEGFFAFQPKYSDGMHLLTKSNVYFEFIPFDENHFDTNGEMINDQSLGLNQVSEGIDYVRVVSTCAGAWRYLIGDTIRFIDLKTNKIKITGRTKHFLNLCEEHLSVDNMTDALTKISWQNRTEISEFVVIGSKTKKENFRHTWYLGCNKKPEDVENFKKELDYQLAMLNTDYLIERNFALEEIEIKIIPTQYFYAFMKIKNKYGAQHKFPSVLKGKMAVDRVDFLEDQKIILLNESL